MSQTGNKTATLSSLIQKKYLLITVIVLLLIAAIYGCIQAFSGEPKSDIPIQAAVATVPEEKGAVKRANTTIIDTAVYNQRIATMVNGDTSGLWPVPHEYPNAGAILPFNRVLAFYGNLYSKRMGVLGEYPKAEMLKMLKAEIANWQAADTSIPVIPALHYIAVTAQGIPGKGGKYRLRMPFHQIDSVINMAKEIDALVFIDVQVGLSTLQEEIPQFEQYLKLPNVHLGIDPEFSMKGGEAPGKVIGTLNADDINYTSNYLAKIARENNLPPKMLVVHRFTQKMVTGYKNIKVQPEVQVIMDMDGWGYPAKKITTYRQFIQKEPVQFTGFKLFYKNDLRDNSRLMTPQEVLKLKPQPMYIQYQ
ncbi:MAG: hypothetical protein JNL23_04230 [Chitinophagaceae bacterium]|nr:hypothetical protein [Chitinophagaceae bacterium]